MPAIDNSFLRSRFARRIFLLFILCALVPLTLAAALSYLQTAAQLREQSNRQALVTSKSIGLEVFRRLQGAEKELANAGRRAKLERNLGADGRGIGDVAAPAFSALALLTPDGDILSRTGQLYDVPALTDEMRGQLARGRTVLVLQDGGDSGSDILMLQAIDPGKAGSSLLAGVLDAERLWALEDFYAAPDTLLVLSLAGERIHGAREMQQPVWQLLARRLGTRSSGHVDWEAGGEQQLATFWSLFIPSGFHGSEMVFILNRPEAVVLAPIAGFRLQNATIMLLSLLIIAFIAARSIRMKLKPLTTLHTATQRIARGDFGEHVRIDSDDEFTALGEAFNNMTERLSAQFASIATMVEIDRLILSSFDARFIISTVLERAGDLTPCSMAALLILDEEGDGQGSVSYIENMPGAAIREASIRLSDADEGCLANGARWLVLPCDRTDTELMRVFDGTSAGEVLAFPLFIKQRLAGVFMFGYPVLPEDEESCASLRKFADHVAVALSNAGWEERLYHQAHYDGLTNLPNRALLKDRLEQAIARARRSQGIVGVLFIDLDDFKLVNDSLGHAAGDAYLKSVADVLQTSVRGVDTVVRFGGDEFIVIVPDISGESDTVTELGLIAENVLAALQRDFRIGGQVLHAKASVGVAAYPKDGVESDELIRNADAAMYLAKKNGRSRYEFFAPELNAIASKRLKLEQELRNALACNEFVVRYQPKVNCRSGELVGAEALISWNHPVRGRVGPDEFIAVAEESSLIIDIGMWVNNRVCTQLAAWREAGLRPVPVAINVSARQFAADGFAKGLFATLASAGIEPGLVELEITETMVMSETEESIARLADLRGRGLRLSLDDFGTGYSSLSYLRRLPIHTLKIDKSFIDELVNDHDSYAIVSATVYLAHKLGFEVVAEGVEHAEQYRLLQGMNCDVVQGYLVSKALEADSFAEQYLAPATGHARFRAG